MYRPNLLLITGDPVASVKESRGDFTRLLQEASGVPTGEWVVIDLRTAKQLPEPGEFRAIIVSGSPALLADEEPWMVFGLSYLRRVVQAKVPLLGVCFGHQMLGQALGGLVGRNPAGREIGSVRLQLDDECALLPGSGPFWVNATHVDSILRLPDGARSLAHTALEPNAVVKFGGAVWGVQFHPEMDAEIIRAYIEARREPLLSEGLDPEKLARDAVDAVDGGQAIANFFGRVVDEAAQLR